MQVERIDLAPKTLAELQSNLMLFFTGTAHDSWAILKEQERSSGKEHSTAEAQALHGIRQLADKMRDTLVSGDLARFGALLDEGWQAKKRVSNKISNTRIDDLYKLARDAGALGGEITGAGGGGFLLLYCEPENQSRVRDSFKQSGISEMGYEFDFHGAQVIANDPFIDCDERCGTNWVFVPNGPEALSWQ